MKHSTEMISAYLDGELTREEVERLSEHLAQCGRCAGEMEEVQRIRSAVRSLPLLELPPGLVPEADVIEVPLHRNRGFRVAAAAAAAAIIIAIAAIFTPEPVTVSADDLASRFAARASLDPAFGPAKAVLPNIDGIGE